MMFDLLFNLLQRGYSAGAKANFMSMIIFFVALIIAAIAYWKNDDDEKNGTKKMSKLLNTLNIQIGIDKST